MMWYEKGAGMMSGGGLGGGEIFGFLIGLVVLADLVLLGIWLWQHISKH